VTVGSWIKVALMKGGQDEIKIEGDGKEAMNAE
jgi:hypothetical protein